MASISTEIYRPSAVVGKWYARVRGANMPFAEVGNWTQAELDIKTKEDKLPDMTVLGGGTHSKIERVEGITLKVKTADLNLNTLARHLRGVIEVKAAGTVTDQAITLYPGGLIPLPHIGVTVLTLKGATDTVIAAAGNYEVRPEGIYVLPGSTAITAETAGKVSYSYGEQATIEALASEGVLRKRGLGASDVGRQVSGGLGFQAAKGQGTALLQLPHIPLHRVVASRKALFTGQVLINPLG